MTTYKDHSSLSFIPPVARMKDYAATVWSLRGRRLLQGPCKAQPPPGERKEAADLTLSEV